MKSCRNSSGEWRKVKETCGCEGERMAALIEEVKDIFSGSRPSWCLRRTAAGVRSLFQPWRQLEVSTPRQPQLYLPTKLSHVFVHTAAPLSQQADIILTQVLPHLMTICTISLNKWFDLLFHLFRKIYLTGDNSYHLCFETVKWPLENQKSLVGFIIEHDKAQKRSYRGAFMPYLH